MNRWVLLIGTIVLFIVISLVWPFTRSSSDQVEIRAAMDIGSGATNLKVAKVDVKTDKIISILFDQSIPVPYQKHLEQSSNNIFDREVMDQGIRTIKALKEIADSHQAKKVVAIATAAFRQAENAPQFAQEIEQKTGVRVRIINQDEEGILAFRGAVALSPVNPQQAVVWDIGGGSMQLTTLTSGGTYLVDKGKTASIPFKNAIIQEIKHEDIKAVSSPNPISTEEAQAALGYAQQAAQAANPFIKNKIKDANTQILAVGSLFNYGIKPLVNNQPVTPNELHQAIEKFLNKPDQELPGGSLAEVAVSNPLLVLGYMQGLEIKKAEVLSVNNADGALTYPAYWEE